MYVFVSVFLVLTTKKDDFVSTTRKIFEVVLNYDIKLPEGERHKDGEAEEEVGGGWWGAYTSALGGYFWTQSQLLQLAKEGYRCYSNSQ